MQMISADDGSYHELISTFDNFAKISGLEINYEKSQVLRLGALHGTDFVIPSNKPLKWVMETTVLGILISANRKKMVQDNYKILLEKLKKTLKAWTARSVTLMGKITIVNSLVLSQTVYKAFSLNTPDKGTLNKIKQIITRFLWDGKKAKISYETLLRDYSLGGLKLQDFQAKNQSLKLSWVKKACTTENAWKYIANKLLPYKVLELFQCNLSAKDFQKLKSINKDWAISSVIEAWCDINYKEPCDQDEILRQTLWLNTHIR